MRSADARRKASTKTSKPSRLASMGGHVGCSTNESAPRTDSSNLTYSSPSAKRVICSPPSGISSKPATAAASSGFAVPAKSFMGAL